MNWHELFIYKDGLLIRKVTTSSRAIAGNACGIKSGNGYLRVRAFGKERSVHRIIWEMHNGEIPPKMDIDHINHIRDDNRIENLKVVSRTENLMNTTRTARNTSGYVGVSFDKRLGKWHAYIKKNYRKIHIGFYLTVEDAAKARKEKEIELGFHENHGKTLEEI